MMSNYMFQTGRRFHLCTIGSLEVCIKELTNKTDCVLKPFYQTIYSWWLLQLKCIQKECNI